MPKGYWMVSADIVDHNPNALESYLSQSDKALRNFGARLLARGGKFETVEGRGRSQFGIVEFENYAAALECYRSPEYALARNAVKDKILFDVVVTEGCDGNSATSTNHWSDHYYRMAAPIFGRSLPSDVRNILLMSDYPQDSVWFDKCYKALLGVEFEYVEHLLQDIRHSGILGDLVEFGIFQGAWLNNFYELTTRVELDRMIWGFDSFAGLSKPHESYDVDFWKEGMYAVSRAEVEDRIRAKERRRIKLIEGYFRDSLKTPEAQSLGPVCFARIDCDIYEPALDCLGFLSNRLSDGAILVFDDWSFSPDVGETRAFFEWVKTTPHLSFEYLSHGPWGHLYLRVRHH
jgi:uncharacterized protein (DUF1330 family)